MRDTMIFYRSFYEAIKELPLDKQGEVYNAIFSYGLDFNEVELSGISKTIWTLIKPQIDANIKRFENGKKPKAKQKESKTEAEQKQETSKSEANNNNNNNNNNNIPTFIDFLSYADEKKPNINREHLKSKYDSWIENDWKDGNDKKITNWKVKLLNTIPYIPTMNTDEETVDQMNDRMLYENVMKKLNMYHAKD